LTVCPSRIRPERIQEMLASYDNTKSSWNDIVVYVADDDPRLEDYKKTLVGRNLIIGKRRTYVEVNNYIMCEAYPDYPYYSEINDDHIYHTPEWDRILIDEIDRRGGWGFACGNTGGLPSGMVTSANIIKSLGFYITPLLKQAYSDDFHKELGEACGMFYRVSNVNIEHKHYVFNKAKADENYLHVTGKEHMEESLEKFNFWKTNYKQEEVKRILDACRGVN